MKLLIATGLYPPDIGGPATYTTMLEAELPARGIEVLVVPYGLVRTYPKFLRHVVYAWKVFCASKRCDLLYALDPVSVGLSVRIVHLLTGKPYFLRVPGDYAWEQGRQRFGVHDMLDTFLTQTKQHPAVRILNAVERWVARGASRVIVPSRYLRGVVHAWGVSPEKSVVIYSALHPIRVSESKEHLRARLGYTGTVFVTAGRLVPWKGVGTLIALIPRLKKQIGRVTLVVVGDGPERARLEAQTATLGVTSDVQFAGTLTKDALGAVLKAADVFVLNTAYEGLSHQLLEVMDIGTPVVTTDVGGNPELITDGIHGLLVSYDNTEQLVDALGRMATHHELRQHIVQRARLRTKEFSETDGVAQLADLLITHCNHAPV
ncbi:glycosyltransferase family 4 protein [Candidatus Kaiserbacteria bacterium]|nr:glycosyltransferase family 4 protein [Candidatus Kaiserbacteria bacterium]